jgi:hypothetical protein
MQPQRVRMADTAAFCVDYLFPQVPARQYVLSLQLRRRETVGPNGKLLMPPRFGEKIGYCPTFLMADEAQQSATPNRTR